jgi:hypothetical protein
MLHLNMILKHLFSIKSTFLLFLLITFFVVQSHQLCNAQGKPGAIMVVKVKIKGENAYLSPDSIIKVWYRGSTIKSCILKKTPVVQAAPANAKLTSQAITKLKNNSNTTENFSEPVNRTEYIRNYETGEALDITYRNGVIAGVYKRTENIVSSIDSTEKIWLNQEKTIAGHLCKKLVLVNKFTKVRDTLFVATDLKGVVNPSFKYLDECPLEYEDKTNKYEVKSITVGPIADDLFTIPRGSKVFTDRMAWFSFLAANQGNN